MTSTPAAVYIPPVDVANPGVIEDERFDLRGDAKRQYYLKHWFPTASASSSEKIKPKATIVFVHGFGEHVQRYQNIFKVFADRGYQVSGYDQRGYGRTWYDSDDRDTTHGWTTWEEQMRDITFMLRLMRKRMDEAWGVNAVPLYMLGHSMGGGLSAGYFTWPGDKAPPADAKQLVSGVMLSAPWLDIHFPVPTWLAQGAMRGALAVVPRMRIPLGPPSDDLSRDPEVCEAVRQDPLCDNYVYTRGLLDPLTNGPKVVSTWYKNWPQDLPIIVSHGSADAVTKWSSSKELVEKLQARRCDATFASFDGYFHEALHEPGELKIKFANTYLAYVSMHSHRWLDDHVAKLRHVEGQPQ